MSKAERIQAIQVLLEQLYTVRKASHRHRTLDKLFEIECYLATALRVVSRNKSPHPEGLQDGVFRPSYTPAELGSHSYLTFQDQMGSPMALYMNCQVSARTEVEHAPDVILTIGSDRKILSIYECKMHRVLHLSTVREFIGYLVEMKLWPSNPSRERVRNLMEASSELLPRIYVTSHTQVPDTFTELAAQYGFEIEPQP